MTLSPREMLRKKGTEATSRPKNSLSDSASCTHHELNLFPTVTKPSDLRELFTLCSSFSTPGIIIMMDTRVPRKRKKVKRRRETVELLAEGQQPQSRHGAEPQRQDTCNESIPASGGSKWAPKPVPR